MAIHTNAKSRLYIGAANNTISTLAEFEAEAWLEIKEVEDIGEFGVEGSEQTFISLADGYVRKLKGSLNSGALEVVVGRGWTSTASTIPASPAIRLPGSASSPRRRRASFPPALRLSAAA